MSFDPTTFLNSEVDVALDTKIVPCPAGEYPALSEKVDAVPWQTKDGSKSGVKLAIIWDIQDENAKQVTGRDPTRVRQDIMLDLTETGQLDLGKGRNVGLGRLRQALGLNNPGEPFNMGMLQGRMALVTVSHRSGDNPEDIYDEIRKVAALS